jgi:hypothetical protein
MRDEEPDVEIPEGWSISNQEFTGHFKLVAEYENKDTGEKIRVTPHKTYSQPGFSNAHRVVYVHPDDGVEEIAAGMEVEHVEDAEQAALEKMEEFGLVEILRG